MKHLTLDSGKKVSISSIGTVLRHGSSSPKDQEDDYHLRSLIEFDYKLSNGVSIVVDDNDKGQNDDDDEYDARFRCDCEDCTPPSSNTSPDLSDEEEEDTTDDTDGDGSEQQSRSAASRSSSGSSSMSTSLLAEATAGSSKDCLQLPLLDDDELDLSDSANFVHLPRRRRGSSIKELLQTKGIEYFDY